MNAMNIDDDPDDYNTEALRGQTDDLKDHISASLDHIGVAKITVRRCIHVITDVRLDSGAIHGRMLDDHLTQLLEIEGDLSRAEGELAE
jgi:hypothetical protein